MDGEWVCANGVVLLQCPIVSFHVAAHYCRDETQWLFLDTQEFHLFLVKPASEGQDQRPKCISTPDVIVTCTPIPQEQVRPRDLCLLL